MSEDELNLSILRNAQNITTQKSFAKELGLSVGKVNYILKSLVEKGFVKAENFATSKNKKQYKYLLTKNGIEEKVKLTKFFIERKKAEYEELQRELETSYTKEITL